MIPLSFPILGLRPFVNGFFKKFPQYKEYDTKRPKDFTDIIKEFHKDLIQEVIDNRYGVDLPLKSGRLRILSFKKNRQYPNFTQYTETGLTGGFSNIHTDGLSCKIVYSNMGNRYRMKDKIIWAFLPEAGFSKRVSDAFRLHYNRYIFSPNRNAIKKRNTEFNWKNITEENIEKFLLSYNEFEL